MISNTPDYKNIIARLQAQVDERWEKCIKNQNEPSRFYYHRKQWVKLKNMLDQWVKEYNETITS